MAFIKQKLDDGNLVVCDGDRCYATQHFHICGSSTVAAENAEPQDLLVFAVLEAALLAQESAVVCASNTGGAHEPCHARQHMQALSNAIAEAAPSASRAHHAMHIEAASTLKGGAPSLKMGADAIGCTRFWGEK